MRLATAAALVVFVIVAGLGYVAANGTSALSALGAVAS